MPTIGNKSVTVVPSDTVDNPTPFYPEVDSTGYYKMDLELDAAGTGPVRYMLAGVQYAWLVKRLYITGTTGTGTMTGCESIMGPY